VRGSDQEVSAGHAHAHDTAPPPLGSVVHVQLGSLAVIDFLTSDVRILPPKSIRWDLILIFSRFLNYFVAFTPIVTDLSGLGTPRESAGSHMRHDSPKLPVPHSPFRRYGYRLPWTTWERSVMLSSQETRKQGQ
jgi:hypothetical protein